MGFEYKVIEAESPEELETKMNQWGKSWFREKKTWEWYGVFKCLMERKV